MINLGKIISVVLLFVLNCLAMAHAGGGVDKNLHFLGYVYSKSSVRSVEFEHGSGQVLDKDRRYSFEVRACKKESDHICLVVANMGLIFSVPKTKLNVGESWVFSGYNFLVSDRKTVNRSVVYSISASMREGFRLPEGVEKTIPKKMSYIYSPDRGLLSWSSEVLIEAKDGFEPHIYIWFSDNSPIGFFDWLADLREEGRLSEESWRSLTKVNLTYRDYFKIITNLPYPE